MILRRAIRQGSSMPRSLLWLKRGLATVPVVNESEWTIALRKAEGIVGYSVSKMNNSWLQNDEFLDRALQLRKMVTRDHPMIQTAKSLLYNGEPNIQAWGVISLLLAKVVGHTKDPGTGEDSILQRQRLLAEICEMIRVAFLIHQQMVNLQPKLGSENKEDVHVNKIGLLTGDYLLATSSNELASLCDQYVYENISMVGGDIAQGNFIGDRDEQNNPIPTKPKPISKETLLEDDFDFGAVFQKLDIKGALGHAEREWTVRHLLTTASLLGRACQSTLVLAGQPEEVQQKGYLFGKHSALAWQACIDMEPFKLSTIPSDATFSLVSAPVLYHLHANPEVYTELEKGKQHVDEVDFVQLHANILKGPGLEKTVDLQNKHISCALDILYEWPESEARSDLEQVIRSMQNM